VGEGASASNVIRALKANGVSVSLSDVAIHTYVIDKDDFMEEAILVGEIGRRFLDRLKRKLSIPIHHFYNPEMAEAEAKEKEDEQE
jgi:hypothetical protein